MKTSLLLMFLRLCLFFSITFTSSSLQNPKLVTRLIHRDSVYSPTYRKNSTISDRANYMIKNSAERLAGLNARINRGLIGSLTPNLAGSIFFIHVSIGDPPVPQLLVFDTGSWLLWVQCKPCLTCRKTKEPKYKPNKSKTYAPIGCHDKEICQGSYRGHCDSEGYCEYSIHYLDGTNSTGVVAYEQFFFPTYNRGTAKVSNALFGCGTKHTDALPENNGVIGFNADPTSFVRAIGTKFSYCLGGIEDLEYSYNYVILGDEAFLDGFATTVYRPRHGLYFITLQSVTVSYQKNLTADPKEFQFNIVFDSGSSLTYLANSLREPLIAEVDKQMKKAGLKRQFYRDFPTLLCYEGLMSRDLPDIPIVFHFDGFDMILNRETLFFQGGDNVFCMAIEQSRGVNIIGILAQQFSSVGYDLKTQKMFYRSADCEFVGMSLNL